MELSDLQWQCFRWSWNNMENRIEILRYAFIVVGEEQ